MTISAKQVMDLRAATGMPMMQCKRALESESGDFEKAVELLRKEGMKAQAKRADKEAKEGLVRVRVQDDGSRATMVAVACETEPVARTEMFIKFADVLVEHVDEKNPADNETLLGQTWVADKGETVNGVLLDLVAKLREKIEVPTIARIEVDGPGIAGGYEHHDKKNGAIVTLSGEGSKEDLAAFAKQLCMHIVFSKPTAMSREDVPNELREKEEAFLREQLAEDPKMANKPPQVVEKILEGKIGSFFKQHVLAEQDWALPDSDKTVGELLAERGAKVLSFRRAQLGS